MPPADQASAGRAYRRVSLLRRIERFVLPVGLLGLLVLGLLSCSVPGPATTGPQQPHGTASASPPAPGGRQPVEPRPDRRPPLHVVALGDSVTAGTRCRCVGFPELYARSLEDRQNVSVRLTNAGDAGATSADLLADLDGSAEELRDADVVLVTIGANDFADLSDAVLDVTCGGADDLACARPRLSTLRDHLSTVLARITQLRAAHPPTILVTGYWNVYEDGNVADLDYTPAGRAGSIALTRAVNDVIDTTARRSGARYVDLFTPFRGTGGDQDATPLLADDGDHPNAAGHRVIADTLLSAGLPALHPQRHP